MNSSGHVVPKPAPIAAPVPRDDRAQLRKMAHALEGMFIGKLFEAMRSSVRQTAGETPTPGEEMFTSLLDDRLAGEAAQRMERGIGEALYRQLSRRLPPETGTTP